MVIDSTWVWRQLAPATPPSARYNADMIWDGSRAILFGGTALGGVTLNDETWELVGDEWNQLAPATSPSARALHHMAWDGARIVLVGGYDNSITNVNDTWEFFAGDWSELFPANSLPEYATGGGVAATSDASDLIWDGTRFLILIPIFSPVDHNGTWKYDGDWSDIAPSPEYSTGGNIWSVAMCWAGDRAIAGSGNNGELHNGAITMNNTSELIAGAWSSAASAWGNRYHTRFSWNGDQVVMFGGITQSSGTVLNDLWVYDKASTTWTQIVATGTPPSPRFSYSMVWDGERLIILGGIDSSSTFDETWVLEPPGPSASINHKFGLGQ